MSGTPVLLDVTDTPGRRKQERQGSAASTGGQRVAWKSGEVLRHHLGAELQSAWTSTCSLAADNCSFWKLPETNTGGWCHPEMHLSPKSPEKSNLNCRQEMKSTPAGRAVSSSATKEAMAPEGDQLEYCFLCKFHQATCCRAELSLQREKRSSKGL